MLFINVPNLLQKQHKTKRKFSNGATFDNGIVFKLRSGGCKVIYLHKELFQLLIQPVNCENMRFKVKSSSDYAALAGSYANGEVTYLGSVSLRLGFWRCINSAL